MPGRLSRRELRFLLLGVAAACGCAPLGAMFTGPHDVDDPYWLSPEYRRFHEPVLPRLVPQRRPLPVAPRTPRPVPVPLTPRPSEPFELPVQPAPRAAPRAVPEPRVPRDEAGPELEPRPGGAATRLELAVAAPTSRQAGGNALFEIRVTNRGARPERDVVLEATLGDGLRLPEQPDRRVVRPLGTIPAGQSREVTLTVVADATGAHCVSFLVTANGHEAGWKRVCVEVVPRQLDVTVSGPEQARAGGRATFVVALTNVTNSPIDAVALLVTPEAVLKPVGGSAGARSTNEGLSWGLGRIAAGERVAVEIECLCQTPAERACIAVQVTAADLPAESAEHCLEITAEPQNPARRDRPRGDWQRRFATTGTLSRSG